MHLKTQIAARVGGRRWALGLSCATLFGTSCDQSGDVLACRNNTMQYTSTTTVPAYTAAFVSTSSGTMDSQVAANATGVDGELWIVVN